MHFKPCEYLTSVASFESLATVACMSMEEEGENPHRQGMNMRKLSLCELTVLTTASKENESVLSRSTIQINI